MRFLESLSVATRGRPRELGDDHVVEKKLARFHHLLEDFLRRPYPVWYPHELIETARTTIALWPPARTEAPELEQFMNVIGGGLFPRRLPECPSPGALPEPRPELLERYQVELPIQVDGRKRWAFEVSHLKPPAEDEVIRMALAIPAVTRALGGQAPASIRYLPGEILALQSQAAERRRASPTRRAKAARPSRSMVLLQVRLFPPVLLA